MAALSTFADGTRLDRIGPNDYSANVSGRYIKDGDIAELYVAAISSSVANDRVHIPDTALAPATPGVPLVSEITAYLATNAVVDTIAFYTGTDNPADSPTYVYFVDGSGVVTQTEADDSAAIKYTQTFVMGDWVLNATERELSIPTTTHGRGVGPKVVSVLDASGDVVGTGVNVDLVTGDVVIAQPDGLQFDGSIVII